MAGATICCRLQLIVSLYRVLGKDALSRGAAAASNRRQEVDAKYVRVLRTHSILTEYNKFDIVKYYALLSIGILLYVRSYSVVFT